MHLNRQWTTWMDGGQNPEHSDFVQTGKYSVHLYVHMCTVTDVDHVRTLYA